MNIEDEVAIITEMLAKKLNDAFRRIEQLENNQHNTGAWKATIVDCVDMHSESIRGLRTMIAELERKLDDGLGT